MFELQGQIILDFINKCLIYHIKSQNVKGLTNNGTLSKVHHFVYFCWKLSTVDSILTLHCMLKWLIVVLDRNGIPNQCVYAWIAAVQACTLLIED